MDRSKSAAELSREIDKFTKLGTDELQKNNLKKSLDGFEQAFRRALQLNESFTERSCAFNVGAVYIALKQPVKGLEFLQKAVPPMNQRDGRSNGDLFYNFALGYEAYDQPSEAARYYEIALDEYKFECNNFLMEAEVGRKLGHLYGSQGHWSDSARCYGIASTAHAQMQDWSKQADALCQQALSLYHHGNKDEAVQVADDCMVLCQRVTQNDLLGKVYNELGLTYTQCRDFNRAAACFELALPLSRGPQGNRKRQAVILQNLGAVYNSLSDYQRALTFHENAATMHADLGNRKSQGQSFTNLAFAQSQLGDNESAGESYLHALQAAKDTGDKHAHWQALEGLGAVAFNLGHVDKAIRYFKQALSTLSAAEVNAAAQERIVGKLTDALQYQLAKSPNTTHSGNIKSPSVTSGERNSRYNDNVNITLNDGQRPPSRQHSRHTGHRKSRRNLRRKYEFDTIALGLGVYEPDYDQSLSDISEPKISNAESEERRPRHTYSRIRSRPGSSRVHSDGERRLRSSRSLPDQTNLRDSTGEENPHPKQPLSRRMSTRRELSAISSTNAMRRKRRPLLRSDSFDSEEEWKERMKNMNYSDSGVQNSIAKMKDKILSSSSELEYEERLYPGDLAEESENQRPRTARQRKRDNGRQGSIRKRDERPKSANHSRVQSRNHHDDLCDSTNDDEELQIKDGARPRMRTPTPPPVPSAISTMNSTYLQAQLGENVDGSLPEEPLYDTIKSKSTSPRVGENAHIQSDQSAPPVPPKNFDPMTNESGDGMLHGSAAKKADATNASDSSGVFRTDEDGNKQRKRSNMCLIM